MTSLLDDILKRSFQILITRVTARAPLKRPSLTNTNPKPSNKNIHEKLRSSSPSNRFRKQRVSPSRKPSQTSEKNNEQYEKE